MKRLIGILLFLAAFVGVTAECDNVLSQLIWSGGCLAAMYVGARLCAATRR